MTHVLVLTAQEGVPDDVACEAAERLKATSDTVRRLAPDAVEIALDAPPRDLAPIPGVDANLVPAAGRRKRLLIADMDSTIIGVECIDELADYAGVKAQVAAITDQAMRGAIDFEAALVARVALLEGLPVTALQDCYDARVRLNPGARTLIRTMRHLGAATVLVSGGFTFFAERVAAEAGFTTHQANVLETRGGFLTGRVAGAILGRAAKRAALDAHLATHGLGPKQAVAIGDGANDLDMIRAAGLGVAYRAKPAVAAAAGARLAHSDLTAVLVLMGIPRAEWQD